MTPDWVGVICRYVDCTNEAVGDTQLFLPDNTTFPPKASWQAVPFCAEHLLVARGEACAGVELS